jgi:unsaturated chondroitin disaccharide hydrolase
VTDFDAALEVVLGRVDQIEAAVGDQFPLYCHPVTGAWKTTRRGAWTGGFWAGLLWLRSAVSENPVDRDTARQWTQRLAPRAADDTVTRGMTFWYGAGIGYQLTGDPEAARTAMAGALALSAAFDPAWGLVPVGSAFGAGPVPNAGIDGLAGVVSLLSWAADRGGAGRESVAERHAARSIALLVAADGAVSGEVSVSGPAEESGVVWARGQAWGMLGCAVAADRLGPTYLNPAISAAEWWLGRNPDGQVPPAAFDTPGAPPDTSAAAIGGAALLALAAAGAPEAKRYRTAAESTVARLVDEHLTADGVLRDGCYDLTGGVATGHELIWGTYFFAASLAMLSGRVSVPVW